MRPPLHAPHAGAHAGHSTADALLFGKKFEVEEETIALLKHVTKEEEEMLRPYYEHTDARLMGRRLQDFSGHRSADRYWMSEEDAAAIAQVVAEEEDEDEDEDEEEEA